MEDIIIERNSKMFGELVPEDGAAESRAGELLRAVNRVGYRFWNDGDRVGIDYGNETCNPAVRYILAEFNKDSDVHEAALEIWESDECEDSEYEELLEKLLVSALDYIESNPSLKSEKSEFSFDDYREEEDKWWNRDYWKEDEDDDEYDDGRPWALYEPEVWG